MTYEMSRDPFPLGFERQSVLSGPTRCYKLLPEHIGSIELPTYSKALVIYVPEGGAATVSMVYLSDDDAGPVTRTFTPGNHYIAARIRRITAVSSEVVEIHIETD